MNARVTAVFVGKAFGTRDYVRLSTFAGRVSVWHSRTTTLPRALELARGMKDIGVRRVWIESPQQSACCVPETD